MTYMVRSMLSGRRVLGLNVSYDTGTVWTCSTAKLSSAATAGSCDVASPNESS
jgi:hypothetical protein